MTRLALIALALLAPCVASAADNLAVVYLDRVFEESKLVSQRSAQLRDSARVASEALAALAEEVKNLKTEVEIRPPTHPKYAEYKERLAVSELRFKMAQERFQITIGRKETELLKQSYQDMRTLIAVFAAERSLDLVLMVPSPEINANNVQGMRIELGQRTVLFHRESLDRTDDFVAFANARFVSAEPSGEQPTTVPGVTAPVTPELAPAAGGN